jgi:magnesium chelatase family protein
MIATLSSASLLGVEGFPVVVEVHVANGLPNFTIVGLADLACRESRDRVRSAILSSNLPWPIKRITVNLAPADIPKLGSGLDLAIAVGVLISSGVVPAAAFDGVSLIGELGLDGSVRSVPGVVPLVDAVSTGCVVVPHTSGQEAACVPDRTVLAIRHLRDLIDIGLGTASWPDPVAKPTGGFRSPVPDMADVRGQPFARLATEIAAAGGHHFLMSGSPGAGKTMLARRLVGLLPSLGPAEALDVLRVRSAAGRFESVSVENGLDLSPPFRAPHHSSSMVSLLGGGTVAMRPGELTLAHRGVLFLDELSEFSAVVLDSLRQPLEEGVVRVARAKANIAYPASFQLVAAMNPCPCGWKTGEVLTMDDQTPRCSCLPNQMERMRRRVSGPLLDRIDVRVDVVRPAVDELMGGPGESSAVIAQRVVEARAVSAVRGFRCNAEMSQAALREWAPFTGEAQRVMEYLLTRGSLTARGMDRVRRVARTIQDLTVGVPDDHIGAEAVMQAVELRRGGAAHEEVGVGA